MEGMTFLLIMTLHLAEDIIASAIPWASLSSDFIASAIELSLSPNKKGIKKVEYLYAGTFEEVFPYLNTNASVHINSFIDMLNRGYDYADLEGVDGTFDDHLSKTKSKYNPVVLEFVGEFDMSINKFWYFIFSNFSVQLKKLYRLVKGNK